VILVEFAVFIILPRQFFVLMDSNCQNHSSLHFSIVIISFGQQLYF